MKKITFAAAALLLVGLLAMAFQTRPTAAPAADLKWYTWEEAVALQKTQPKKLLIDVYTDWCGWCKKMDKSTFIDQQVMDYLNKNFYAVKLNAEQRADIVFNNETFKYVENGGSRGVHTLAYALLDGKMGYPTIVYLNEKFERILISPGYKDVPMLMKELQFTAEEAYSKTTWEEYRQK